MSFFIPILGMKESLKFSVDVQGPVCLADTIQFASPICLHPVS